jgi:endo-1,3-1,4-beta-glycanase ExoK
MAHPKLRSLGCSGTKFSVCCILLWAMLLPGGTASARGKPAPKPPPASDSFTDHLQHADTARWSKADGWTNGSPFDNAWAADHVLFQDNAMILRLDDTAQQGQPYTSGEYRSNGFYGYGCFEVSMKPAASAGLVTAFFTFAGSSDNGGNGRHNEIDVEFAGDTQWVQVNFWTNDDDFSSHNEYNHRLGFDASQQYHVYGFRWTSTGIRWYVDGTLIYEALDALAPTPKATESLQKIMMNLWAVDESAESWAGAFEYPGTPVDAAYEWVRYTAGEDCTMDDPPAEPPPPGPVGDGGLYVLDIQLGLNKRRTQAIANVIVRDSAGEAAQNASVSGQWTGAITRGDTSGDTSADGSATFYSARSRASGAVEFCVTDIMLAGFAYDPAANLQTCASVTK